VKDTAGRKKSVRMLLEWHISEPAKDVMKKCILVEGVSK
jgi:hypothetical protein